MRKICVVTGSRAEYGLLYPVLDKINKSKKLILQLLVTGSHLSEDFGLTYKTIEKDFKIDSKIDIEVEKGDISNSISLAIRDTSKRLKELNPDLLLVLGDRYEIFAVATSATVLNIPIAHIHGGEATFGAQDEIFRHCITKMSYLHFTATNKYRKRVIQLGEDPKRVFNVGSLGVENIKNIKLLKKNELEMILGFRFLKNNILITFHPETLSKISIKEQFNTILNAIDRLDNTRVIFTKANADTGGIIINKMIDEYLKVNEEAVSFTSMGVLNYFSTIQNVDCVLGNSSSGIIEVPSFNKITLNIGQRQEGRIRAKSVIDIAFDTKQIYEKILYIFKNKRRINIKNPYEKEGTSSKIIEELESQVFSAKKSFYDI